ncbi:Transcription factor E2F8, partial [Camelus dromedarius]
ENLFFEPHKRGLMKTPLKESTAANRVLAEIQPDFGPLTTPTKPKEISPGEPWTPTANLKMLISAVSPEIRNRDQKRGLFDNRNGLPEAKDCLHEHLSGDEYEKSQPSRKEKSLGLLCHKFLARYPNYPNPAVNNDICLDEVAEELNVERRRIYDIVNVLESLHMVSRLAKNRYTWHGRHNLNQTLGTLKSVGEENKYAEQIMMIKKKEYEQEFDFSKSYSIEDPLIKANPSQNGHSDMCFVELPGVEFRAAKIRRLYDIANVLSSLDLIKKVHVTEERGRKPAFKWTGPEISPNTSGTYLFSFIHCFWCFICGNVYSFALTDPLPHLLFISSAEASQNSAPFPSKMAQLAAICKMQLEEQSSEPRKKVKLQLARSGHCKPLAPLDTPANTELEMTAPSLIQPLGVVPLIPSPLSSAVPMILPQAPSGPSYAIYLQPAQAQTMTPPQGLSPTVSSTPSSKAMRSKDSTEAMTENTASDAAKPSAPTRPGSLLPGPERQGTKNKDREPAGERGAKRASLLEDSSSKKKFKEDQKGLENVSAPVPVTPKGSQLVAESFFRTPGGPTKPAGSSCVDFDGASKTSVGTLFVPQRKLEVSTDVH